MKRGICWRCHKPAMVNICIVRLPDGFIGDEEICADCFDVVGPLREYRTRQQSRGSSDEGNINPWQDDAIRALEEDR